MNTPPTKESGAMDVLTKRRRLVYCTQFASCRWSGYRTGTFEGVKTKPCPKCGKDVTL